ncbi:hypothetical protein DF185_01050 [Marinifilum breve]|uniref:Uncharacterized protein n=1 Tax=Marinifilum breve TaxID=2184082 RepID=A0A2V4A212_9BACT|nr:hypothetical protein [Marinifilum breve]PXY02712.1 hypothetical protein DF185_01050 [Marinifilum breve]
MEKDLIPNQISDLSALIKDSEALLKKDAVSLEEKTDFKKKCAISFVEIINAKQINTATELAKQGLKYEVIKIKNPTCRWIYNLITEARDHITFDAPYIKKKTDSDYYKTYIFWTKQRLEGIRKYLKEYTGIKR